jgi:hypothetical protein
VSLSVKTCEWNTYTKQKQKGGEGEEDKKEEEKGVNLFAATGVWLPEYWQCIHYIAPSQEKKNWTAGIATSLFCTHCKAKIKYNAIKNNKGIKWHMNKYHPKLLQDKRKQKVMMEAPTWKRKLTIFSPMQVKEEKKLASQSSQMKLHELVALWTAWPLLSAE